MFKIIGSDQKVYGPATTAQLRQWMAEGRAHPTTLAQLEGSADWKSLSSFPEFAVPPLVNLPSPPVRTDSHSMALAGMICGIVSIFCCCLGPLFAILGLIFSIIVLSRREDYPAENSRQMALAGLILSIIGLLCHWLLPLFFLAPGAWSIHRYQWRRF